MSDETPTSGTFLRVIESGTIITKVPALADGPAQYAQLHELVGGFLECFYQFPADDPPGKRMLQFYCDEDGLQKDLPYNLSLRGHPIVGPVVIVAAVAPRIYGLTEREVVYLTDILRAARG